MMGLMNAAESREVSPTEISSVVLVVAVSVGLLWQVERESASKLLSRIGQALSPEAAKDTEGMDHHLLEERMSLAHGLALFLSCVSGVLLIATLLIDYASGFRSTGTRPWQSDLMLFALLIFCTRAYSVEVSVKRAWATNSIVLLATLVHSILASPSYLLASGTLRLSVRVCAWVAVLDLRFVAVWSMVTVVVHVGLLVLRPHRDVSPGLLLAGEMSSVVAAVLASVLARSALLTSLKQNAQVAALSNEHTAATRMLSVLCDAQVLLGEDLRIIAHCSGLSNLLITGAGDLQSLIGARFVDYMSPTDQERFNNFILTAAKTMVLESETDSSKMTNLFQKKWGPPASLPVAICDSAGLHVAVELYHIILPDSMGRLTHLLGITELDSSRSQYGSVSGSEGGSSTSPWSKASHGGASSGMKPLSEDGSNEGVPKTLRDLQEPPSAPRTLTQGSHGSHAQSSSIQDLKDHCQSDTRSVSSDDSGSCSDSSVTSAAGLLNRMCNCPEFEAMEFVVDPFCNELSIREVHLFVRRGKDVEDRAVPALGDWLWPDCKRKFRDFVQGRLNEVLTGHPISTKTMSSLTFKLPSRSSKFGLVANSVGVAFFEDRPEDEEAESVHDGDAEDQPDLHDIPDMTARIQCSAFMLKRMSASKPQLMKDMEQKAKVKEDLVRSNSLDGVLSRTTPSQTSSSSEEFSRLAPIQEGRRRPGSGIRSRRGAAGADG